MSRLAQTLELEGKYDEAAQLLQLALPIEERAYGPVHPKVAFILNLLAGVDERSGKLDQAESHLTRMLSIERSVYGEKNFQVAVALGESGECVSGEKAVYSIRTALSGSRPAFY